jgi:hypothetical protein
MVEQQVCIAFQGDTRIASGDVAAVALAAKRAAARGSDAPLLIFDANTSDPIEIDCRGTDEDVLRRLAAGAAGGPGHGTPRGPGRPKLGVVAREVTLLPRHWDWLSGQPGGASVALRKLVEHAMRANAGVDRIRASQNAAYKFMSVMAGNRVGFEDAARALFAGDIATFDRLLALWPVDIRSHVKRLATDALQAKESPA